MFIQGLKRVPRFVRIGYKTEENKSKEPNPGSLPIIGCKKLAKEQINQLNTTFNTHKTHDTTSTVLSIGCITHIQSTMVLPIL
jgi:hypothetical protein